MQKRKRLLLCKIVREEIMRHNVLTNFPESNGGYRYVELRKLKFWVEETTENNGAKTWKYMKGSGKCVGYRWKNIEI